MRENPDLCGVASPRLSAILAREVTSLLPHTRRSRVRRRGNSFRVKGRQGWRLADADGLAVDPGAFVGGKKHGQPRDFFFGYEASFQLPVVALALLD